MFRWLRNRQEYEANVKCQADRQTGEGTVRTVTTQTIVYWPHLAIAFCCLHVAAKNDEVIVEHQISVRKTAGVYLGCLEFVQDKKLSKRHFDQKHRQTDGQMDG